MSDPLTTAEVARLVRRARGALLQVPTSPRTDPMIRRRVDEAQGCLDELLWLVDLVEAVNAGFVVVVDPDRPVW